MGCDNENGPDAGSEVEYELMRQNLYETSSVGTPSPGTVGTERVSEAEKEQYLTIRPTDDRVATFEATVDGVIEPTGDGDLPGLGKSVEDAVSEGSREYRIVGSLMDVRIKGPAAAFLDGERVA
ncbi:hypothetical protein NDI76_16985 [Halogeometricum sp. S1BR25-6]|uniref:CHRD domain-containing protein n=1 Tax=Halogeometricum salsisoli TaxID=2950536 RepID=A0ABU2GI21_9EURY|nr:hypothetical protein [Halogeometricum sp. S1BR25-6]MDS0300445.1 hypothetical protein [Halogeometricum sp. S1BR25-6]